MARRSVGDSLRSSPCFLPSSRRSGATTRVPDDKSLLGEHRDRLTPASRLCVGNLLVSTQAALGTSVTSCQAGDLVLTTHSGESLSHTSARGWAGFTCPTRWPKRTARGCSLTVVPRPRATLLLQGEQSARRPRKIRVCRVPTPAALVRRPQPARLSTAKIREF